MSNLKKIILLLLVLLIVGTVWYVYDKLFKEDILPTKEKTEVLSLLSGKKIYVRAKNWGIAGNHEEIVFSENPITIPNKEKDYIFYINEVVYKVENNKLYIYACDCDASIPKNAFRAVEVIFKDLKNADEIKDYSLNYEKYGLEKITF